MGVMRNAKLQEVEDVCVIVMIMCLQERNILMRTETPFGIFERCECSNTFTTERCESKTLS